MLLCGSSSTSWYQKFRSDQIFESAADAFENCDVFGVESSLLFTTDELVQIANGVAG